MTPRCLLTLAIIATQLTLGTTLGYFEANAAASFVVVALAEELPQHLPPKVRGGVELSHEFSRFVLVFQEEKVEEDIFWRCGVNRPPAEAIDMGLGFPRPMLDCEVVLLQCCRPEVEKCRPCPHRFEPLQGVVVRVHLKWHSHEVGTKLDNGPNGGETFQLRQGLQLTRPYITGKTG